jgi:hypothetical protein
MAGGSEPHSLMQEALLRGADYDQEQPDPPDP